MAKAKHGLNGEKKKEKKSFLLAMEGIFYFNYQCQFPMAACACVFYHLIELIPASSY